MADMLSLPNELVQEIFTILPNVQTAACFSRSNKRLYDIWISGNDVIITSIMQGSILAYDEALVLATANIARSLEKPSNMQMKTLVPELEENDAMCRRVCAVYNDDVPKDREDWRERPWDFEAIARHYYRSRLCALAHEHPQLRRDVRRRLKRLSRDELQSNQIFVFWWKEEMREDDIREWHDMGIPEQDADIYALESSVPDQWHFAVETITLYKLKTFHPDRPFGREGLYSDTAGRGFRDDWW